MKWVKNDGGRLLAGYVKSSGDCVVRAIAIAANMKYQDVYDDLHNLNKHYIANKRDFVVRHINDPNKKEMIIPDNGVFPQIFKGYIISLGFSWVPIMQIGSGCKVHLKTGELPDGRLIVRCSHHLCAVIDNVIHDTYNPSRDGTRCVYGYFKKIHDEN